MLSAVPLIGDSLSSKLNEMRASLRALVRARAVPWLDRATAATEADLPLVEAALARLDPTLSLRTIRARVVAVRAETHDVTTFVLRPNARFTSFRAGSYVTLQLTIDGRPVQRSYSISSAPSADGLFAITVKRVAGGLVSNWLADHVRPGQVLELSAPRGQFVLPPEVPRELLMLSAGSGITPVMSMLRQLRAERRPVNVTFVHFARTPADIIFRDELAEIESELVHVRMLFCVEQAGSEWAGARGRFSLELLESVAPGFRELDTYMCGPSPFMQAVIETFESSGADLAKLRYERFSADFDATKFLAHAQLVRFLRSGSESIASRPRTILEEAESLGVAIESGCRAGNCGTCRCLKRSGVVNDVVTGRDSGAGEEFIYPCISIPRGTVEIEL
jgi:stearoyl-CoA 9-desaturase NADPH oxidoreductase